MYFKLGKNNFVLPQRVVFSSENRELLLHCSTRSPWRNPMLLPLAISIPSLY